MRLNRNKRSSRDTVDRDVDRCRNDAMEQADTSKAKSREHAKRHRVK